MDSIQNIAVCICFILLLVLSQVQDSYFHEKNSPADELMPPVPNSVIVAIIIFGLVIALEDFAQQWYHDYIETRVEREDPEAGIPASAVVHSQPPAGPRAGTGDRVEDALLLVPYTTVPSILLYPQEHHDRDQHVLYLLECHPVSVVTEVPAEAVYIGDVHIGDVIGTVTGGGTHRQ
ncbi:uncharacterized protein LOC144110071 [Amblyomma americanum]